MTQTSRGGNDIPVRRCERSHLLTDSGEWKLMRILTGNDWNILFCFVFSEGLAGKKKVGSRALSLRACLRACERVYVHARGRTYSIDAAACVKMRVSVKNAGRRRSLFTRDLVSSVTLILRSSYPPTTTTTDGGSGRQFFDITVASVIKICFFFKLLTPENTKGFQQSLPFF